MIYRMIVEGDTGSPYEPVSDSLYVFFSSTNKEKASSKAQVLFQCLAQGSDRFDCYNCSDEVELKMSALEPDAFEGAFFFESGCRGDEVVYSTDSILFLVGEERQRVSAALRNALEINMQKGKEQ